MDIVVAYLANDLSFPLELYCALRIDLVGWMAADAHDRSVTSAERKPRRVVVRNREEDDLKSILGMARFTLPAVGSIEKPPCMRVLVAIGATLESCDVVSELAACVLCLWVVLVAG
jgi:hypothetical protein